MLIKLHQKNIKYFHCELCDYKCSKRGDFNRHILTNKHIRLTETNKNASKNITQTQSENICDCGKIYKHKSSLCKHKKTCSFYNDNTIINNKNTLENLVIQLMSENNEIKNTLIRENIELKQKINEKDNQINELLPKLGNITNNTINNNYASSVGNGLFNAGENTTVSDNRITNNGNTQFWPRMGGGVYNIGQYITIVNNLVEANYAEQEGGGIFNAAHNAIVKKNSPPIPFNFTFYPPEF